MSKNPKRLCAIVGSGPAALMAADVLSAQGVSVAVFEKKLSPAKKLLIAGSSGLNVTNTLPQKNFAQNYRGPQKRFESLFKRFSPTDWRAFLNDLKIKTFVGTSGRVFVDGMKAAPLLKAWLNRLKKRGAAFHYGHELVNFESDASGVRLEFANHASVHATTACLALGGASYEPKESPLRWPAIFKRNHIAFTDFTASNVGFALPWPEAFLKEAEGLPLKNIVLRTARGEKQGELMITRYGLEGTPVYHVGISGDATIDLKPDVTAQNLVAKMKAIKENLAPLRRAKKNLGLSETALALLFHMAPPTSLEDIRSLATLIKNFPVTLGGARPIEEAISSAGGVSWDEIADDYSLKKIPNIFVAGEMIDWDAPTGGFLIQACVSQGFAAAQGMLAR